MWSPVGRDRFLAYAAVFWTLAAVILWRSPRRLMPIVGCAALLYTAWWAGPLAPFAVLYFLGSCYFLGRFLRRDLDGPTAVLLGAAVWMLVIWTALHFPINTRWVYAGALLIPYILSPRSIAWNRAATVMERKEVAALAVLLFVLIAHLLAALKPETSADGLSMHLALPMAVARDAQWAFDFRLNAWALMPNGGDSLYAAVYLLGGEQAAHLLNFAFLATLCVLLARAARRWVSPSVAWLLAALFASTPLVQLVTASLFVENVWAALILAAALALLRYLDKFDRGDLLLAGLFAGAALSVKLMAAGFAAPLVAIAAVAALRKQHWKPVLAASALFVLFAAPPYAYAFAKTGNPVFPFANARFRAPYFDTQQSFSDPRFAMPVSWMTPYKITFQSGDFLESRAGAAGFQYFLLFLPAALCARRKDQWTILAIAALGSLIVLTQTPYLRYLYPAMPLASIAIAWIAAEAPALLLIGILNLWFLPSSGFYNQDFALFRHSEIAPYVERAAPARLLIDDLNRRAPGQPVAFFSVDEIAGASGPAYTDTWHNQHFSDQLRDARDPRSIAVLLHQLGVRYVVAPVSRSANLRPVQLFYRLWLDPVRPPVGTLGLYRMHDPDAPRDTGPVKPGRYDDLDPRVEYTGPWHPDLQFPESSETSITYSDTPGAAFRITFSGSAITYVYTQAANRGIAAAVIDGGPPLSIDEYSGATRWQNTHRWDGMKPGLHTLEIRVSGQKNAQSSGIFVDLDAFQIDP